MTKQMTDPSPDNIQNLGETISSNLKKLIAQLGMTQKELAEKLGVTASSMTDYCKGRRIPNVEFFVSLKNLYGISIDDFLTNRIHPSAVGMPSGDQSFDQDMLTTYHKYCGLYYLYYFDTSKYKGRDTQPPKDSLVYGVLCIYENSTPLDKPDFGCAAILGIKNREDTDRVKKSLEKMKSPAKIIETIETYYPQTSYFGDFELSREHGFISMKHAFTDKSLIILHRVDSNKPDYTGGIGTINSISRGRERMPVVQFIGISRHPLSMSIEEIHHSLLLNYPIFKAEAETEEMVRSFKKLYLSPGEKEEDFSEYQKTIFIRSLLERYIKKSLERNVFRYGKISERDDDEWYHAVKDASRDDSAQSAEA